MYNYYMHESWKPFLEAEFNKPYFKELAEFLHQEYENKTIFPKKTLVFSAFTTDLNEVKVVILVRRRDWRFRYRQINQYHHL